MPFVQLHRARTMLLCLDIGNSHLFGGVFADQMMQMYFRHNVSVSLTSDQLGVFLRNVLRENSVQPKEIDNITISSVVPSLDYSVRAACKKYFSIDPAFLTAENQSFLKIKTDYPGELGSDLVATGIAAVLKYPGKDLIVVDFGTATTFAAITKNKEYLGTVITPGMRLCMESLQSHTEKLPSVEIMKMNNVLGTETVQSIQSGLYYGHVGMIKEITAQLKQQLNFSDCCLIATGGCSHLFKNCGLFHVIIPDLLFHGLRHFIGQCT
jgi:type III pantothenate kinase